jgi:HlyD family secretion protein
MKKRLMLVVAVLAALTASVAAYYRANHDDAAPRFLTAGATRGDVVDTVEATGTLEAVTTVQVGTQVSGTIKALHADFNSEVRKGQVIAELEPSLFETQVEQARATLVRLQAEVDRAKVQVEDTQIKLKRAGDLWAKQLIPATDLETAQANARQAEAALKAAEAQVVQARASLNQNEVNLGHTIIRAPIDGIVLSRSVDVGQTVAASMQAPTLFVIARDLARMQVNASVGEADIGRIRAGQKVAFRVDAYPNDTFSGQVSQVRLQPVVEQNVVSYLTVIDVPNRELKLKPGMTATVTIEVARNDNVLRVPNAALRFRPDADRARSESMARSSARVWVLDGEQLKPIPVRTGVTDGANTAILGGDLGDAVQVVTGMAAQSATTTQSTGSPLLPFGGRNPNRGAARQGGAR